MINRYPAASHSFIRREIEAIEAEGAAVSRFSVRPVDRAELPDPRDQAELEKTTVILAIGGPRLLLGLLMAFISAPARAFAAIGIAFDKASWSVTGFIRRTAYLAEGVALARRMRSEKIGHLHAHFGTNPAMVARIASRFSDIPFSFTVHGPDEFDAAGPLDLRGKIADAAFCVAISSYGRSQLMRWSAFAEWNKIRVVRCGVDATFLDRPASTPVPSAPRLCAVARLSAQKGIPLLIEAAAHLHASGKIFHLTLVGDGEMRSEVEAMIRRFELEDIVEITGWSSSEQVVEHLLAARAMVLPSFAEGLPVVIMEALALERPVIATAIAGTPELVDGECGWLIPAGSIEALVEAMDAAIGASEEGLGQMGRIGRERVAARHDSRANGRQLLDLFQDHAKRRG